MSANREFLMLLLLLAPFFTYLTNTSLFTSALGQWGGDYTGRRSHSGIVFSFKNSRESRTRHSGSDNIHKIRVPAALMKAVFVFTRGARRAIRRISKEKRAI